MNSISKPFGAPRAQVAKSEPQSPPRRLGGWVRVDSDNVLRGWAVDRDARGSRLEVEILVNGEVIATVLADRLEPKLVESGEGDGRYGFALVVPERFRDGQPHGFEARVAGTDFLLKAKVDSFVILPGTPLPAVELERCGPCLAIGRVRGGQQTKSAEFEVWRDGRRLAAPVETHWSGPEGARAFSARLPAEAFAGAGATELTLALPGMVEAGLPGAPLQLNAAISAVYDAEAELAIRFHGETAGLEARGLEARLYDEAAGRPVLTAPLTLGAVVRLPFDLTARPLTVRIAIDDQEIGALSAPVVREGFALSRNGAFQRWSGGRPLAWETGDLVAERAEEAVPATVAGELGAASTSLRLQVPPSPRPQLLLRQALKIAPMAEIGAAILFRAPRDVRLEVRVGGVAVIRAEGGGEAWVEGAGCFSPTGGPVELELFADGGAGGLVEVAGLRLGGEAFRERLYEVDAAILLLNNLYLSGTRLPGAPDPVLRTPEGELTARDLSTAGREDGGGREALAACFPVPDTVYARLAGGGAPEISLDERAVEGVALAPAGTNGTLLDQVRLFAEDRPIELALLAAYTDGALRPVKPARRYCKIEEAMQTRGGRLMLSGWAAAVGDRPTLLVDPATLRHWDLGATSVLYQRKDVDELLRKQDESLAGGPAGFVFAAETGPAERLCIVALSEGDWLLQHRGPTLPATPSQRWETTLKLVRRLTIVSPDRLSDLLDLLDADPPAPAPAKPPAETQFGPVRPIGEVPRLTVVAPLYRESFLVMHLIDQQRIAPSSVDWVLVNDYPPDETSLGTFFARRRTAFRQPTRFRSNPRNLGFAGACNAGAAGSDAPYLLFMNSDVHLRSFEPIEAAMDYMDAHPDVAVCGFRLRFPDGTVQHSGMQFRRSTKHGGLILIEHKGKGLPYRPAAAAAMDAVAVTGALLLVRRGDDWGAGFDERYVRGDFEDADLCLRARAAGRRVVLWDTDVAYHLERQSVRADLDPGSQVAGTLINSAIFTRRWGASLAAEGLLP